MASAAGRERQRGARRPSGGISPVRWCATGWRYAGTGIGVTTGAASDGIAVAGIPGCGLGYDRSRELPGREAPRTVHQVVRSAPLK